MERSGHTNQGSSLRSGVEFDLSHASLKESANELPLWVGNLRREYYKKYKGNKEKRLDKFELVGIEVTKGS